MKTLKNQILPIMLVLSGTLFYAQEPAIIQNQITFQNIQDSTNLYVDLDGIVNAEIWNKDYVYLKMEIKANIAGPETAKYLVSEERYCLKLRPLEDGSLVLYMPNLKLPVFINGRRLNEDISFRVCVPQGMKVKFRSQMDIFPCPPEGEALAKLIREKNVPVSKPATGNGQNSSSL